jgi:carbon-monoxide dehydrogenase iron sulfur subunit
LKRILVRKEVCSGCRACEVACVARHDAQFGTATARIKVAKIEPVGLDVPNVCRLCRRPACVAACPTEALYRDEVMGVVRVKAEDCIGCSACVDACPFGMVTLHSETDLPLICDLCDGDPACVKRCATQAIIYTDEDAIARERREQAALSGQSLDEGTAL